MKDSASGVFSLILLCDKLDTLHGQTVNALHQRFSRNVIFTASTLDLKHIFPINDTAISNPQSLRSADLMLSITHLFHGLLFLV